jgi:hypothetical protein
MSAGLLRVRDSRCIYIFMREADPESNREAGLSPELGGTPDEPRNSLVHLCDSDRH